MLKKAAVLGSVITLVCVASAEAHSPYFKSGFMAGAHVGLSKGTGTFNSTYDTKNALLVAFPTSATGKARETNALYGIMGGYRHLFNEGYTVGLDVSLSLMSNNDLKARLVHINNALAFDNKLSRDFSAVPSINFGKIFCNRWHVALGLGLGISRFQQQVTSVTLTSKSEKSSSTKLGFVPSVNIEYAATQNVSFTGNLSYEIYKKLSKTFGDSVNAPFFPGSSYTTSIKPRYVTLKAGAVYRF